MMKLLKLAVLVVLIALFVGPLARALLNNQSPPSKPATAQPESKKKNLVNQELLAELRPIIPKCKDALTRYRASGIVGDVRATVRSSSSSTSGYGTKRSTFLGGSGRQFLLGSRLPPGRTRGVMSNSLAMRASWRRTKRKAR